MFAWLVPMRLLAVRCLTFCYHLNSAPAVLCLLLSHCDYVLACMQVASPLCLATFGAAPVSGPVIGFIFADQRNQSSVSEYGPAVMGVSDGMCTKQQTVAGPSCIVDVRTCKLACTLSQLHLYLSMCSLLV